MSNSPTEPKPSYVKLAMRNMVRKGATSMKHFALTAIGLLAVFVGLAYLTHWPKNETQAPDFRHGEKAVRTFKFRQTIAWL